MHWSFHFYLLLCQDYDLCPVCVCVGASERQTSIAAGDDGNTDLLFAITSPTQDENGSCVSDSHTVSSVYPRWMERLCKSVCVCVKGEM